MSDAIAFTLNGKAVVYEGDPFRRLADVLRGDFGLTGTKTGCDAGDCGACTVLLDGRQVFACMVALGQTGDCEVVTVEGLGTAGALNNLQRAFLHHGAAQCGICTPGMVMAAEGLLRRHPDPSVDQIRDGLGANICRCTGYVKIIEAVQAAAR